MCPSHHATNIYSSWPIVYLEILSFEFILHKRPSPKLSIWHWLLLLKQLRCSFRTAVAICLCMYPSITVPDWRIIEMEKLFLIWNFIVWKIEETIRILLKNILRFFKIWSDMWWYFESEILSINWNSKRYFCMAT